VYGAGLLGCTDELDYVMTSAKPEFRPFNMNEVVGTDYPFTDHQPTYFCVSSFEAAKNYCRSLASKFRFTPELDVKQKDFSIYPLHGQLHEAQMEAQIQANSPQ
jgi:phenylalanine-4-hydroxylase